jgi:hypothetical protein
VAEISTAILSALAQTFAPDIKRQWNRTTHFLGALSATPGSVGPGAGKNVAFDVEFTGSTAGTVAEGADVATTEYNSDIDVPAIFNWATYRSSFQISEQEVDMARTAIGSADAIMNIFGNRILGCSAQLARAIEYDCMQGTGVDSNGNPTIIGIFGGAISSTGIYGGLNPVTYPEWAGNLVANGGVLRTMTPDILSQGDQLIFANANVPWNLTMTTAGIVRKYESFFTTGAALGTNVSLQRSMVDGGNAQSPQYGTGFPNDGQMQPQGMWYKGYPLIRNPVAPVNKFAFLNTDHIKIKYLPHQPTQNEIEFFAKMGIQGSTGGQAPIQATGIPVRLVEIAKTGDSHKISMRVTLAMAVTRRNACAIVQDLSEV